MSESSQARVLLFFGLGGTLAAVATFLLTPAMLDTSSTAMFLFANPSFVFASSMLLIGFVAISWRLLPAPAAFSGPRVAVGFILSAATYPLGLVLELIVSSFIPESFPYLNEIGLIMSLAFVAVVPVVALRLIYRKWPSEFWKGVLGFCLCVPTFTAILEYLFFHAASRSHETIVGLVVSDIILSLLLGHWVYSVALPTR